MALHTFFEPNWERTVRAAYAEAQDNDTVANAVENIRIIIENNAYLYRIEHSENGSFIGFVVYEGNGVPTPTYNGDLVPKAGKIRPQFMVEPIISEYNIIISQTVNNNL